jgi:hypothetical protein
MLGYIVGALGVSAAASYLLYVQSGSPLAYSDWVREMAFEDLE